MCRKFKSYINQVRVYDLKPPSNGQFIITKSTKENSRQSAKRMKIKNFIEKKIKGKKIQLHNEKE